ncbi:MAG: hypothetical protein D6769_02050 [Methanobacteriota archaeon]|nr:MAG: hypothetical protein D6769_02050 [Euryarchaeota archaeon]
MVRKTTKSNKGNAKAKKKASDFYSCEPLTGSLSAMGEDSVNKDIRNIVERFINDLKGKGLEKMFMEGAGSYALMPYITDLIKDIAEVTAEKLEAPLNADALRSAMLKASGGKATIMIADLVRSNYSFYEREFWDSPGRRPKKETPTVAEATIEQEEDIPEATIVMDEEMEPGEMMKAWGSRIANHLKTRNVSFSLEQLKKDFEELEKASRDYLKNAASLNEFFDRILLWKDVLNAIKVYSSDSLVSSVDENAKLLLVYGSVAEHMRDLFVIYVRHAMKCIRSKNPYRKELKKRLKGDLSHFRVWMNSPIELVNNKNHEIFFEGISHLIKILENEDSAYDLFKLIEKEVMQNTSYFNIVAGFIGTERLAKLACYGFKRCVESSLKSNSLLGHMPENREIEKRIALIKFHIERDASFKDHVKEELSSLSSDLRGYVDSGDSWSWQKDYVEDILAMLEPFIS